MSDTDVETQVAPADDAEPLKKIYECVTKAIQDRRQYEERLRVCWDVRHNGVTRKRDKSWQSDTPLKIADPAIDKIKPQLVQGIFTADVLATFCATKPDIKPEYPKLASQYFTDKVKRDSNFFRQFVIATDMHLQDGRAILKVIWNPFKERLEFHAIHSMYFVVPSGTEELEDATWACQIHRMSKDDYRRMATQKGWENDDDFVDSLVGMGASAVLPKWVDEKKRKEGLHFGTSEEEIIIWEYYERDDTDAWQVWFIAPSRMDEPLDGPAPLPYNHGKLPYIGFESELKDKDYHSPRGVVEKILPEERIATLYRNYIGDHAAFSARPMFTTNGTPVGNTNNLTADPGKVFPGIALESVQMAPPPEILAEEMANARTQGEQLGGAGDYALQQPSGPGQSKPRTATEIGVVAQLSSVQMDLRSRLNRDSLTNAFRQAWLLIVQYCGDDLTFFYEDKVAELPQDALADAYLIVPSGNPDGYSHSYQIQLAMQVFQMAKGDPAFDQDELKKYALESVDPSLVKRLFIGAGVAKQREAEDQGFNILLLREGMPVMINPGEDQAARAILTAQYLQRVVLTHEQIPQIGMQALQQHILARVEALYEQNPQAAYQLKQQLKAIQAQTIQMVKQQQAQAQQQAAAASTVATGVLPSANGAAPSNGAMPMPPPRGIQPAPGGGQ